MGEIDGVDKLNGVVEDGGHLQKQSQAKVEDPSSDEWYECPLPKPPLPDLSHTLARYLEYAAVLAQTYGLDLERTRKCVEEFERKFGQKLVMKMAELAGKEENWINCFWLPEMYLRQRPPLPLNFNPAYIFPRKQFHSEGDRLNYASWLVRGFLDYKMRVDKKQIPRETIPDRFSSSASQTARMCMDQYERILNFYRQPGQGEDFLLDRRIGKVGREEEEEEEGGEEGEEEEEEHILVLSHLQAFLLFTRWKGQPLPAAKIASQLAKIRKMSSNRGPLAAVPIGGASTGQRDIAAQFWAEMIKEPVNERSIHWVRSSVFVLCLDDDSSGEQSLTGDLLSVQERDGLQILHGFGARRNGLNRCFDATIQLIVSGNGCCGMCIEHSVAEGIVYIKMTEEVIRFTNERWERQRKGKGKEELPEESIDAFLTVPEPMPLSWAVSEKALKLLHAQIAEFDQLANDLQLRVLEFTGYGKSEIKGWRVSPDGFVQLCMQLAHFKQHGYLVNSYESATMRRFRFGRVDNIRAATPEALEWVKGMGDRNGGKERRRALFRAAADKQARITRENVTGHGIDNHLCALEVLSREEGEAPELFSEPMWREMMRFPLSTSQVSTSTSPDFNDCYLCYGPVVRDGYGCAYNIQPGRIVFAISAWKTNPRTDVDAFRENLKESLTEMRQILED